MSTESETKSAGVPAGATQKCTDCGQYWNARMWPLDPVVDSDCPCTDRRPIAEAVPAQTQFSTSLKPAQDGDSAPEAPSATAETASSAPAAPTTAAPAEPTPEQMAIVRDAIDSITAPLRARIAALEKQLAEKGAAQ